MHEEVQQSHRSGVWKQQNKVHKTGRHRSKGRIDSECKGRASVKSITKRLRTHGKADRRHHALQMRTKKREEVLNKKRNIGGRGSTPHLVAIIPLHHDVDINQFLEKIKESVDAEEESAFNSRLNGFTINVARLRHTFTFIKPMSITLPDVLDCGLVADTVIFMVSLDPESPVDNQGQILLSAMLSQGISASGFVTAGLNMTPIKKRADLKKTVLKILTKSLPDAKLHIADTEPEIQLILRMVAEKKRKDINLRQKRPYMIADVINLECDSDKDSGMLAVTGFVRGECFDVNRLVHVVGWGDYQINRIDAAISPLTNSKPRKVKGSNKTASHGEGDIVEMRSLVTLAVHDADLRQDMIREAEVDPLDAEQTWPTEEEIKEAEKVTKVKRLVKRVPEGTSEYQAAWIMDSDEEWEEEDGSGSDISMEADQDLEPIEDVESQVDVTEFEGVRVSESTADNTDSVMLETASQYDEGMDFEEERLALERHQGESDHKMFPDEIDTPCDEPARIRFQKYRGLRSFRTSPWDVEENLPLDYAKIFKFQNFNRTRKRIRALNVDERVQPGTYVTIYLENVPKQFLETHSSQVILYGMFPHEQKMSVMHLAVKRTIGPYKDLMVKNKDELLFYVGFRRFRSRPIFSQHTNGDKHKMERYMPKEGMCVATVYAQIMFPPCNALVFKETSSGLLPVASGNVFKIDPDRVVTKRIVLSGHPFRINKRLATIRYMFYNPDDCNWFKAVELRTKWGRRGHIKEALGTHGHMKCLFDAQLTSQDTVMMQLYKRVYPKWFYELVTPTTRQKPSSCDSVLSYRSSDRPRVVRFDDEFFD